jgi:hypothetical protein
MRSEAARYINENEDHTLHEDYTHLPCATLQPARKFTPKRHQSSQLQMGEQQITYKIKWNHPYVQMLIQVQPTLVLATSVLRLMPENSLPKDSNHRFGHVCFTPHARKFTPKRQ